MRVCSGVWVRRFVVKRENPVSDIGLLSGAVRVRALRARGAIEVRRVDGDADEGCNSFSQLVTEGSRPVCTDVGGHRGTGLVWLYACQSLANLATGGVRRWDGNGGNTLLD